MPWFKRFSDIRKSCNTKQDELKRRVDLRKEGEICQAGFIKGPMMAPRDFKDKPKTRGSRGSRGDEKHMETLP